MARSLTLEILMDITFKRITIETYDDNLNGVVKANLTFKKKQTISDKKPGKLGDHLRSFVLDLVDKGTIPFSEERPFLSAVVKDDTHGEVSCLIKNPTTIN